MRRGSSHTRPAARPSLHSRPAFSLRRSVPSALSSVRRTTQETHDEILLVSGKLDTLAGKVDEVVSELQAMRKEFGEWSLAWNRRHPDSSRDENNNESGG